MRVVINADDLGMSPAVNDAIFAALAAGVCTSASLLATGPAAEDALRRARALGIPVGVHLALTEFPSLTRPKGLVDATGTLLGDTRAVGPEHADAVRAEWLAQIARVRDAGVAIDHLDGHQHAHHRLPDVLLEVCAATGLRRVRGMGALRRAGAGTRVGALVQPLRALRFRRRLRAAGLVTTDGFAPVDVFLAHGRAWGWKTVELMAHPGNPHHARYAEELAALAGGALDRLPFAVERVGWGAIG